MTQYDGGGGDIAEIAKALTETAKATNQALKVTEKLARYGSNCGRAVAPACRDRYGQIEVQKVGKKREICRPS